MMNKNKKNLEETARLFGILSNPCRLDILCFLLKRRFATVNAIAEALGMKQSLTSQYLRMLQREGIIGFEREGNRVKYYVIDDKIRDLLMCAMSCAKGA